MIKVSIAGVPEHFNLPWHMAIEDGAFTDRGIDLQWTDVPEGTGKMSQWLRDGQTDLAIVLTEGIIKSIADGSNALIAQEYVASPLLWGIHVHTDSRFTEISQLQNATAAISRPGSGSQLMACIHAVQKGWNPGDLRFKEVHTLEGAIDAMAHAEADYFMWEYFTTKPVVDRGLFRHLGNCPTPWPCFVIAVSGSFISENSGIVRHILEIINTYTAEFRQIPSIDRTLANRYVQKLEDVRHWLSLTRWSQSPLKSYVVDSVQNTLYDLNLINKKISPEKVLFTPF